MQNNEEKSALVPVQRDYLESLENKAAQTDQTHEKLIRALADFDNYRKRSVREREDAVKFANETFIEKLLSVIDSFELGIESAKTARDPQSIAQGMQMALNQLLQMLEQAGVERVDALGQPFDPHQHEAVSHQESVDTVEGIVLQQLRRGYKLRGRLVRPASVIVAKAPASV